MKFLDCTIYSNFFQFSVAFYIRPKRSFLFYTLHKLEMLENSLKVVMSINQG